MGFMFTLVLLAPKEAMGAMQNGLGGYCGGTKFVSQLRNPQIGNPQGIYRSSSIMISSS